DALAVPAYCRAILDMTARGQSLHIGDIELVGVPRADLAELVEEASAELTPQLSRSDRNTLSVQYGQRLRLKTFRRIEEGVNPDLEVSKFFAESYPDAPLTPLVGHMELRRPPAEPMTLGVLRRYVTHQ